MVFLFLTKILYILVSCLAASIACLLGWRLVRKARSQGLRSYNSWLVPFALSATMAICAVLLDSFGPRSGPVLTVSYYFAMGGHVFLLLAFVRLGKALSPLWLEREGQQAPVLDRPPQEGVWPPPPKR